MECANDNANLSSLPFMNNNPIYKQTALHTDNNNNSNSFSAYASNPIINGHELRERLIQ